MSNAFKGIYFQPVAVILLVQAVKNVQIPLVSVLAMLVTKAPNVMLLVVVTLLGLVALHVISRLDNVLVKLGTPVSHVIPVRQITTEQVMELVQVSKICC